MMMLSNRSGGLDGLYHYQKDVNTPNEGKCLVEFCSRPPSAGNRLQFRRIRMKPGPEYLYCTNWTVDCGVNRWCTLVSRKTRPRMSPQGTNFWEPRGYVPGPLL